MENMATQNFKRQPIGVARYLVLLGTFMWAITLFGCASGSVGANMDGNGDCPCN